MSVLDELEKLERLRQSGALSEEEFARAKAKLLDSAPASSAVPPQSVRTDDIMQPNQWAMVLHLSQLAGVAVPLAGLIVPIVIWQLKKTEIPIIDVHGKIVVNWIISEIIYFAVAIVLSMVIIGIPLAIAVGILAIVFPIMGGIKANNGEVWPYPLSLKLIR